MFEWCLAVGSCVVCSLLTGVEVWGATGWFVLVGVRTRCICGLVFGSLVQVLRDT